VAILGLGSPIQEEFLADLVSAGFLGKIYTCGGFLHQTARGRLDYYPPVINSLGLRWMYRMLCEPHVFWRTLKYYPRNATLLLRDLVSLKLERTQFE
jgi:UDP-N-acetyl-D-mannosaminuronic acid transferase (WecB/TagA/CpsF family)